MDIWVVAAAAAAVAKYCQNLLRNRDSLSDLSYGGSILDRPGSPLPTQQLHSESRSFCWLARRNKLNGDVSIERGRLLDANFTETSELADSSVLGKGCSKNLKTKGSGEDCNVLPVLSLQPGLLRTQNLKENGDGSRVSDDGGNNYSDLSPGPSIWRTGSSNGSFRKRSSLKYKQSYGHSVKPLCSLESCLMVQLYKKHAEMQDYVLSSLPSSSAPTVRPLCETDESQIIGRASGSSSSALVELAERVLLKEPCSKEDATVIGVTPLPKILPRELPGKVIHKSGREPQEKLGSSNKVINGKHFNSQAGSTSGSLLFCYGLSIGIISAVITNKREVNNLKELLEQTRNLVQDLQDELEMKDSLTMKELTDENNESPNASNPSLNDRAPIALSSQKALDKSRKSDGIKPHHHSNSESISNIEAELEAELERLELSMKLSSSKTRLSELVELDPDFEVNFVQGESRAEMVGGQKGALADPDQDTSSTSTPSSENCAVSPRELSLHLHEVIQSRLEERVIELETALRNSQRKVRHLESEHENSVKEECSTAEAGRDSGVYNKIGVEESAFLSIITREGNNDSDDEMEKLLIKQIVEKTKKGSPVILNAQRLLFSMDEDGHYH